MTCKSHSSLELAPNKSELLRCLHIVEIREMDILPEFSVYGPNVGTLSENRIAAQDQLRHLVYKNDLLTSVSTHVTDNIEHSENSWCFKHFFQARFSKCLQSTLMVYGNICTYTDIWKIIILWKDGEALTVSTDCCGRVFYVLSSYSISRGFKSWP